MHTTAPKALLRLVLARHYAPGSTFGQSAGPSGARVVIIAGNRDIGVMQVAEIAADRRAMAAVKTDGASAFEALYEVEGVGRTNIKATPVTPGR